MIIDNWFGFHADDSLAARAMAYFWYDTTAGQQKLTAITGFDAHALACYVMCRLASARGYSILSSTIDFDEWRETVSENAEYASMLRIIDALLDSILPTIAMQIGTEDGGWSSQHCNLWIQNRQEDNAPIVTINTRSANHTPLGSGKTVDIIAACCVLNALSGNRSLIYKLNDQYISSGNYSLPLLSYAPGHYQHSDGKADWLARAGKIGYVYHSRVNYGGGYDVFDNCIAPLIWELKANPAGTVLGSVYARIDALAASLDVSTLARKADVNTAAGEVVQAVNPSTVARQSDVSDALASIDVPTLARKSDIDGLATTTQVDSVSSSIVLQVQSDIRDQLEPVATKEDLLAQCSTLATKTDATENRAAIAKVEKDVADLKPSKIATAVSAIVTAVGVAADLRTISAPDDSPSQQRESPALSSAPSPTTTTSQIDYYEGDEI